MRRPLTVIGFTYFLMMAVASFLSVKVSAILAALLLLILAFLLVFRKVRGNAIFIAALFTACAALSMYGIFFSVNYQRTVDLLAEKEVNLQGIICDIPYENNGRMYYTVATTEIGIDDAPQRVKLRISSLQSLGAQAGDQIKMTAKLFVPPHSDNGYSSRNYYRGKGIYLFAYAVSEPQVGPPPSKNLSYYLLRIRVRGIDTINALIPERQAKIANGVVFGYKNGLSVDIESNFRRAGVSHMLVVSGLHLSILCNFLMLLLAWLGLRRRKATWITAVGIVLFMGICGFTPSVVRAGMMNLLFFIGLALGEESDALNSLGFAVLVLLLPNPFAAMDVGLQLSFLSTLGIILMATPLTELQMKLYAKIKPLAGVLHLLAQMLALTVSATLFILPLMLIVFGEVSLISPLSNIVLSFCGMLLLVTGVLATVLNYIPFLQLVAKGFALVAALSARFMDGVTTAFSTLPFAVVGVNGDHLKLWMALSMLLIAFMLILYFKNPPYRTVAALCSVLFMVSVFSNALIMRDKTVVAITAQDGALSAVVTHNGISDVIGCGTDIYDAGRVLTYLGSRQVGAMVLTDANHASQEAAMTLLSSCEKPDMLVTDLTNPPSESVLWAEQSTVAVCSITQEDMILPSGARLQIRQYGGEHQMMLRIGTADIAIGAPYITDLLTEGKAVSCLVTSGNVPPSIAPGTLVINTGNAIANETLATKDIKCYNTFENGVLELVIDRRGGIRIRRA